MGYRKGFRKIVKQEYPDIADSILFETEQQYQILSRDTEFSSSSSNPLDRRLDFSAYFLAFIQTLENNGFDFNGIRSICLNITKEYVRPKNKFQAWMKRLPPKLTSTWIAGKLLKFMDPRVYKKGHTDGFSARVITDKKDTYGLGYGIDILECGICRLFAKHDASKYATILCEVDKITSSLAGLELIRKGTIANGAEKCDFRFKKMET